MRSMGGAPCVCGRMGSSETVSQADARPCSNSEVMSDSTGATENAVRLLSECTAQNTRRANATSRQLSPAEGSCTQASGCGSWSPSTGRERASERRSEHGSLQSHLTLRAGTCGQAAASLRGERHLSGHHLPRAGDVRPPQRGGPRWTSCPLLVPGRDSWPPRTGGAATSNENDHTLLPVHFKENEQVDFLKPYLSVGNCFGQNDAQGNSPVTSFRFCFLLSSPPFRFCPLSQDHQ